MKTICKKIQTLISNRQDTGQKAFATDLKTVTRRRAMLCMGLLLATLPACKDKFESDPSPQVANPSHQQANEEAFPKTEGVIRNGTLFGVPIRYELIGDKAVFQGDIILTEEQLPPNPASGRVEGTAYAKMARRWTNSTVYYTIDPSLAGDIRVTNAISTWEQATNVSFVESSSQTNRIKFVAGSGCSSAIGMIGGEQTITVGPNCGDGNLVHEIGHALGLFHEHQRQDRDKFITVDTTNIKPSKRFNYDVYSLVWQFDHGAFNFNSIMMYDSFNDDHAIDKSKPVMTRKNGTWLTSQRDSLTAGDAGIINEMYPGPLVKKPGKAKDIGVGADGSVFSISVDGRILYKWNGTSWDAESIFPLAPYITLAKIDVTPNGVPWVLTNGEQIFRYVNKSWIPVTGKAKDIGIGANGAVFIIGATSVSGGYSVHRYNGNGWNQISGGGIAIDVDPNGTPWLINSSGQIFTYIASTNKWLKREGLSTGLGDIATGLNGQVYTTALEVTGQGNDILSWSYAIQRYNGAGWTTQPAQAKRISAGKGLNELWVVSATGDIYRRSQRMQTRLPLTF